MTTCPYGDTRSDVGFCLTVGSLPYNDATVIAIWWYRKTWYSWIFTTKSKHVLLCLFPYSIHSLYTGTQERTVLKMVLDFFFFFSKSTGIFKDFNVPKDVSICRQENLSNSETLDFLYNKVGLLCTGVNHHNNLSYVPKLLWSRLVSQNLFWMCTLVESIYKC